MEQINKWRPLAWLPNRAGFRFTGLTKDGKEIECVVKKVDGIHTAYTVEGEPCFKQLKQWR